jgi:tRNA nucleotidyltransferase (CCA-adding enzyme)
MRLCRQSAQLGFNPTEECKDGARRNRHLIEDISVERIWAELQLILTADTRYGVQYAQYNGLKLMHDIGVLDILIPELTLGDGMAQRADYHNHDVLEHSLRCVMYAPVSIRLAALLHDVGKPKVKKDTGKYFGHEIVGAQIASGICARLHVPKHIQEQTVWLTANHMYDLDCKTKESKVRKFIVKNLPYFDDIIAIKQADYSACKDDLSPAPCVERWLNVYKTMEQEGAPFKLSQLKVRGDELIGAGIPHEYIGKTLNFLLETCALEPTLNIPQTLIKLALGHYREISSN